MSNSFPTKETQIGTCETISFLPRFWQFWLGPPLWPVHQIVSSATDFPSIWLTWRLKRNPTAACSHLEGSYKDNAEQLSSGVAIGDIKWPPASFWELQRTSRVPSNQHSMILWFQPICDVALWWRLLLMVDASGAGTISHFWHISPQDFLCHTAVLLYQ